MHNGNKLVNPLDSPTRHLILGEEHASLNHIYLVYATFSIDQHGLQEGDFKREDRQNWIAALQLASKKVQIFLLQLRECAQHRKERTKGTQYYLQVISSYIDIFLSTHLSLFYRCKAAAKVSFFFCLWKLWLHLGTHTYSLKYFFISRQAYLDMQISCHYIVLLIKLFKDKYNHLEVPFGLLGSDVCKFFLVKLVV